MERCRRRDGEPWSDIPDYYLPQLAINMEVFRAEYAYLMCWTRRGAALFFIARSQAYWDEARRRPRAPSPACPASSPFSRAANRIAFALASTPRPFSAPPSCAPFLEALTASAHTVCAPHDCRCAIAAACARLCRQWTKAVCAQLLVGLSEFWHDHYLPGRARVSGLQQRASRMAPSDGYDRALIGGLSSEAHMAVLNQMRSLEPPGKPSNAEALAAAHAALKASSSRFAEWTFPPAAATEPSLADSGH